jgi:2,5-diketo-D-gluconate reductase A
MDNVTNATVTLASGARIPKVGFGVWQAGGATKQAVLSALELGYRHIDTAAVYGNEAAVGAAIAESGIARDQIFVTTKLWNPDHGFDKALKAYDTSLRRLKLDYVDLYLIHWPVAEHRLESWKAIEKLKAEQRVRSIGVSNYLKPHLDELTAAGLSMPDVNQIELTPFLQRAETTALCQKLGIVLEAYSPLTHGKRLDHPVVIEVAGSVGRSVAQVLLRWGLQRGFVILPKAVKPEHIQQNAAIFDFELEAAAMARLDALEEGLVTGWNPETQA